VDLSLDSRDGTSLFVQVLSSLSILFCFRNEPHTQHERKRASKYLDSISTKASQLPALGVCDLCWQMD